MKMRDMIVWYLAHEGVDVERGDAQPRGTHWQARVDLAMMVEEEMTLDIRVYNNDFGSTDVVNRIVALIRKLKVNRIEIVERTGHWLIHVD